MQRSPIAELPSFTIVGLATTYELTDNAQLTTQLNNLFVKSYEESWGYFAKPPRFGHRMAYPMARDQKPGSAALSGC